MSKTPREDMPKTLTGDGGATRKPTPADEYAAAALKCGDLVARIKRFRDEERIARAAAAALESELAETAKRADDLHKQIMGDTRL